MEESGGESFELDFEQIPDTEVVCEKPPTKTTTDKYNHELIQVSDSEDDSDYCEVLSQRGGLEPVSDDDCVVIDVVKRVNNSCNIIRDDNNCKVSISHDVEGDRVFANKDEITNATFYNNYDNCYASPAQVLKEGGSANDVDEPVLITANERCDAVFLKKSDEFFVSGAETSHLSTLKENNVFTNEEKDGEIHDYRNYSNELEPISDYEDEEITDSYFAATFNKLGSFLREENPFKNDHCVDKDISASKNICDQNSTIVDKEISSSKSIICDPIFPSVDKEISLSEDIMLCDAASDESSDLEPGEIRDDEDEDFNPILDTNCNKMNEFSMRSSYPSTNVPTIFSNESRESNSGNIIGVNENSASNNNNFNFHKRYSFNVRKLDGYNSSKDCEINHYENIEDGEVLSEGLFEKPTPIKPPNTNLRVIKNEPNNDLVKKNVTESCDGISEELLKMQPQIKSPNTNIRVSNIDSNNCLVAKNVTESCDGSLRKIATCLQNIAFVEPTGNNSDSHLRVDTSSQTRHNSASNSTQSLNNISRVKENNVGLTSDIAKNNKENGENKERKQSDGILASEMGRKVVYCDASKNLKNNNENKTWNELNANGDYLISVSLEQIAPAMNVENIVDEISKDVENASEGNNEIQNTSVVVTDGKIPFMKPTVDVVTFIDITASEPLVVVKPVEKIAVPDSESDDDVCYMKPASESKKGGRNRGRCVTTRDSSDLCVKIDVKREKSNKRMIQECRMYADRLELDRELRMREKSIKNDENKRGKRQSPDDWRSKRKRSKWNDYRDDSPFNGERHYAREMRRHAREMSNHAREIRNHARKMSDNAVENRYWNRGKRDRSRKRRSGSRPKSDRKSEIRDGVRRKQRDVRNKSREMSGNREWRDRSCEMREIVHEVRIEAPETQYRRHETDSLDYSVRMTLRCERNVNVGRNGMPTITITPNLQPAQPLSRSSKEKRFQREPNRKYPPGDIHLRFDS